MQAMLSYAADLLLMSASLSAAIYCMVLSRRLSRLGSFDKGIGSAIAVLSAQVDEMKAALGAAKAGSDGAGRQLNDLVRQANDIAAELEMMIAACHDFAETALHVQSGGDPPDGRPETVTAEVAADDSLRKAGERRPSAPRGAEREPPEELPVFGTRRSAGQDRTGDGALPVFRRRSGTGG